MNGSQVEKRQFVSSGRLLFAALCLFAASIATAGCRRSVAAQTGGDELMVFAAASLQDVLEDVSEPFHAGHSVRLVFHFAGSQELARQIEATRQADVFLSANEAWVDRLQRDGLVSDGTRSAFLSNRLVVVANPSLPLELRAPEDLARSHFDVLAIGDPKSVPAGMYAKQWLEQIALEDGTLWDRLKDRAAPAPNVRAALATVESHESAVGIVYRTDLVHPGRVRTVYEVPEGAGPKIQYVAVALVGRPRESEARAFVTFLSGSAARARFLEKGFVLP